MPRHPSRDPSPSSFGPLPTLDSLSSDSLEARVAPWATVDSTTGFAAQRDVSHIPFRQGCSPLVFGGGVLGQGMYNSDDFAQTEMPVRILRLALRYGINAIDTSPYYYPSEFILGRCLSVLTKEHPRSSFYLCTKAGRYGPDLKDFDYSPEKIRSSVEASLRRLGTDYLDLVYLHDAEFVAEPVGEGQKAGMAALLASRADQEGSSAREALGLSPGHESRLHGPGDETLLAAVATLFQLKDEGKIRNVGISGYPLPVLLRLSRLVASRPPFRPLDVVLSYSNHTLHSDILPAYIDLFRQPPTTVARENGQVAESTFDATWVPPLILNGSPFSMGLLTDAGPPQWHPASKELQHACKDASAELVAQDHDCGEKNTLATTALTFGIRGAEVKSDSDDCPALRTLLGMSMPAHIHSAINAYKVLLAGVEQGGGVPNDVALGVARNSKIVRPFASLDDQAQEERESLLKQYRQQVQNEEVVLRRIESVGKIGWSWASPGEDV